MNRIRQLRAEREVKQADLARHLGVAQNTLSYWENGKFEPDIEAIIKIAAYFNVSTDYLLGLTEHSEPRSFEDVEVPEDFLVLARKAGGVSEETRKHIFHLLNSTLDNVLATLDADKEEKSKQNAQKLLDGSVTDL